MVGRRTFRRAGTNSGFTLAEALVAMVFVGVVLPAAIHGVLIASRLGEIAQRQRDAAFLADRLLNERVAEGDWLTAERAGTFGDDWPGYRWTLETESWTDAGVWRISVTVYWAAQGKEYSVCLTTVAQEAQDAQETQETEAAR